MLRVRLLVQLLHALDYLPRLGLREFLPTPRSVGVVDGAVRVFDVAAGVEEGGTLEAEYLGPEVLHGMERGIPAALYAVGVFAINLLGDVPMGSGAQDVSASAWSISSDDVVSPHLAGGLQRVISRLLDEDPARRYASPEDVVTALSEVIGSGFELEGMDSRESVLRAGVFTGRALELTRLRRLMALARDGHGGLALVGGESGVGKSRLVRELRAFAILDDITVVESQGVSDVGQPFHIWRDVLRALVLTTELDSEEASVLAAIIPDLEAISGFSIELQTGFDASAMHQRFVQVVKRVMRRRERPTLVLLEDVQWARRESLALLTEMESTLAELPVLVVATFRDDELRDLSGRFEAAEEIHLSRFERNDVTRLVRQVFARDTEVSPHVIEHLLHESEGNPFFLIETLRALLDLHGGGEGIMRTEDLVSATAGGIRKTLRRRLARLSSEDIELLQIAAICGRRVDFELLLPFTTREDAEAWAIRCEQAAVFTGEDGSWRFAHDKLRETVIEHARGPESLLARADRSGAGGVAGRESPVRSDHRVSFPRGRRCGEVCPLQRGRRRVLPRGRCTRGGGRTARARARHSDGAGSDPPGPQLLDEAAGGGLHAAGAAWAGPPPSERAAGSYVSRAPWGKRSSYSERASSRSSFASASCPLEPPPGMTGGSGWISRGGPPICR